MKNILASFLSPAIILSCGIANASTELAMGNTDNTLSYSYCQSETSGNYFVSFNAYPKRKIQAYSISQATGKLQLVGREVVILSGNKVGEEYRENAVYSTNEVTENKSTVSNGRVSRFDNLSTAEEGWGKHGAILYDAGNDSAEVLNEFEGTSEKFACNVIGVTNEKTRDYITGVFERYEARLGLEQQENESTAATENLARNYLFKIDRAGRLDATPFFISKSFEYYQCEDVLGDYFGDWGINTLTTLTQEYGFTSPQKRWCAVSQGKAGGLFANSIDVDYYMDANNFENCIYKNNCSVSNKIGLQIKNGKIYFNSYVQRGADIKMACFKDGRLVNVTGCAAIK